MTKRVLAVGNCSYDHRNLEAAILEHFDVEIQAASRADEAMRLVSGGGRFDLVLVNRVLEADRSSGLDLIRQMKSASHPDIPAVMLVSNFPEAQQEAIAAGAQPGFGKKSLRTAETIARLRPHLG